MSVAGIPPGIDLTIIARVSRGRILLRREHRGNGRRIWLWKNYKINTLFIHSLKLIFEAKLWGKHRSV